MTLIGRYPHIDVGDARPAQRLDGHNLHDATAREDALLGALAQASANDEAAKVNADPEQRPLTRAEVRALEDKWAAHWWAFACTPHEQENSTDYARIVACRQDRGGRA